MGPNGKRKTCRSKTVERLKNTNSLKTIEIVRRRKKSF